MRLQKRAKHHGEASHPGLNDTTHLSSSSTGSREDNDLTDDSCAGSASTSISCPSQYLGQQQFADMLTSVMHRHSSLDMYPSLTPCTNLHVLMSHAIPLDSFRVLSLLPDDSCLQMAEL